MSPHPRRASTCLGVCPRAGLSIGLFSNGTEELGTHSRGGPAGA